jgi:2-polyprenyl-3-methyl-5-hydroxy-6-metoxy-1,4-benzoquinol methylase
MENEYLEKNKAAWNAKTAVHIDSDFYDMPAFLRGETTLKPLELELLGDVSGKRILHLQCHFGQDTLSLARMGAIVTGVDLSDAAIVKARELTEELGLRASFVNCDLYSLKEHLHETFDIVFTSYGTIGWLPDLDKWADIVQHFLKPGGTFVMVDFHPVVWMFDDHFKEVAYPYFNTETIVEQMQGSYADRSADISYETVSWNHPTSELLQSLLDAKLQLTQYKEWDFSPYACFQELNEDEPGVYRVKHLGNKIPMVYGIKAIK